MRSRWLPFLLSFTLCLVACTTPRGGGEARLDPSQLAKSDIDRVADVHRRQLDASLKLLAEKLYKRNPREWRKSGQPSMETAVGRLVATGDWHLDEFGNKSGTDVIMAGLREDYTGDRVAAFIGGLGMMLHTAFNDKHEFYMYDDIDPQRLYNAARNIEIAAWKLANSKDASGQPLLLSNEMGTVPNLSFEREFGRMIASLDLLSTIIADRTNRTVVKVVQSMATAVFLPVVAVLK